MRQIKYPKKREALLKHWHGDDWTEEDQQNFVRARNTRQCGRYRNKHRDAYTKYTRDYQQNFRANHPNYYRYLQQYRRDKKRGLFEGTFKDWQDKKGVKA